MSEDLILAKLRALKEADVGTEASSELEVRLLEVFDRRRVARWWKRSAAVLAIAAGIVGMLVVRRMRVPPAVEIVPPPVVAVVEPAPAPAAKPHPTPIRHPARKTKVAANLAAPPEVATEFFPLMDTPPPFEHGELLRVVVPAATMRTVGLPVMDNHLDDPVQADILVGQEGLARAIRFVDYQR